MEKPEYKERHKTYRKRHPEVMKLRNLEVRYRRQLRVSEEYKEKAFATWIEIEKQKEIIKQKDKSYKKLKRIEG